MILRILMVGCALNLVAQQPLDRAWQLAAEGHRAEAIAILRGSIGSSPNNADQRLLLGSLLMEEGQKEESLAHLNAAVRLRPRSEEAQNALGEAYNKFGNVSAARTAFEKAVALKPTYGIAQSNLGLVLLSAGRPAAAATHLDHAIALLGQTDDAADAHYLRAKVYAGAGDPRQAERHLRQAVSIRPKFAEAWSDLGQARRVLLDDAGALNAFDHAVAANPEDPIAQYRLGSEYLRQAKPHLAVSHLEAATRLNPSDQSTLNSLQTALRQDGDFEAASKVKQRLMDLLLQKDLVNQNQLTAVKLNNDGAVLEKSGDLGGALLKYEEASRRYPEHLGIRLNYGLALLRTGRWQAGLDQLRDALKRDPTNLTVKQALDDALQQAPR